MPQPRSSSLSWIGDALALIDAGDARALALLGLTPSRHLAAYGTLRPGQSNHHHVASLRGAWRSGTVLGTVVTLASGYPGLTFTHPLSRVPVEVLESDDLPHAWPRLDRFEGPDYQRRLVQVALADGRSQVAYAYVAGSEQLARP